MELLAIALIVVGLVLFFLYQFYFKKKSASEAIEEVMDYVSEHHKDLLALTKEDLFEMSPEEIESLCGRLGIPIEGSNVELITKVLDYVDTNLRN